VKQIKTAVVYGKADSYILEKNTNKTPGHFFFFVLHFTMVDILVIRVSKKAEF